MASEAGQSAVGNPAVAMGAAVGGAVVAVGAIYVLSGVLTLGQDWPLLVAGPIVGGAAKLIGKGVTHPQAIVVAAMVVAAGVVGFVAAETLIYEPFMLEYAIRRILSLLGIVLLGVSGWLGYAIALRRG